MRRVRYGAAFRPWRGPFGPRKRLADGGEEDFSRPELYQLLDKYCHADKTYREEQERAKQDGGRVFLGCHSQLSPELRDIFHDPALKPKQLSGLYPGATESLKPKDLVGYDINSCRSSALERCGVEEGLPVFCVTDCLVELAEYVTGYDFYMVINELVWREAIVIMIRTGDVNPKQRMWACRATGRILSKGGKPLATRFGK